MCSRPCGALGAFVLAVALVLPLSLGCGHKDDPKPPPQKIPEPIRDLKVSQRGDVLRISFTYPQVTISGLPIDDIVKIELWEYDVAVPEFALPGSSDDDEDEEGEGEEAEGDAGEGEGGESAAEEVESAESDAEPTADTEPEEAEDVAQEAEGETGEEGEDEGQREGEGEGESEADQEDERKGDARPPFIGSKETLLEVDPREFSAAAQLRLTLEGETLSNAIRGASVEIELELEEIEPGEKTALVFGVKSFQSLKRASRFSNLFTIIPRITPEPPTPELEAVSNGVLISWEFEGEPPLEYRFYRRDPLASAFGEHFGQREGKDGSEDDDEAEGEGNRFLDSTAEAGKSYVYSMSVVVNRTPLVESALSSTAEIGYQDVFPPEPPADLVVLSEVGVARLLWEGSEDANLEGYVVYRRTGSRAFAPLNEKPVAQTEYSDTTAESGRTYAYRVVAIDRYGNMSEPSEEVEVRIP